jgi:hypothetical protein
MWVHEVIVFEQQPFMAVQNLSGFQHSQYDITM